MAELLHELFEHTALRHPASVAVDLPPPIGQAGHARLLTYRDLLRRAQALRRRIAGCIREECVVAIALPKTSPCLHAAQLAVLQAGAAFLCVDLAFPDEHLRFVLEDSQATLVLADAETAPRLLGIGVDRARLVEVAAEPGEELCADEPDDWRAPDWLGPWSLAYLIYTSGTMGRPKAVMIEHRSVVHLLEAEQEYLQLHPDDRCLQVSSNVYDSSIEEIWLPFVAGATVVVAADNVTRLGPDLVSWLRTQRITVMMPTPTMLRSTGCCDPAVDLPDLRIVYAGGEAITQDLVDVWARSVHLENGYGPTECTVTVTRARLRPGAAVTIGRAIGQSRAHILDRHLQPVAAANGAMGPAGELCFSGPCLARGYLRREELTAERFPEHPQFGRIYRTGDLVCQDEHGDLHYLGRIDAQVKVRGYRIELAAIEVQLQELPAVKAAACRVQGEVGRELLAAHVVPADPGRSVDPGELAAHLRTVMPEYMVPSRFAVIDRLPTLVSGKLDREALPEVAAPSGQDTAGGREPRTPEESGIAQAFAATLALERVGIDVDFFDLGGNSLRAAELITRLRQDDLAAELTVRDVYELRTVEALAARALASPASRGAPRPVARPMRGRPLLVTLVQCIWLLAMLAGGSALLYLGIYIILPWLVALLGLWPLLLLLPVLAAVGIVVYVPFALIMAVLAKRWLIGRYCPVRAPVWGSLYLRNWIVQRCVALVPWGFLQGTELFHVGLRALGANIGKRVHVHRGVDLLAGGWDLLSLGDDVTLSQDALVGLVEYDDGDIVFGSISMGDGSTLDVRAGMQGGSALGANAFVTALSNVAPGTAVPPDEQWNGVPAIPNGKVAEVRSPPAGARPPLGPWRYAVLLFVVRSALSWIVFAPTLAVIATALLVSGVDADEALAWFWRPTSNMWLVAAVTLLAAFAVVMNLVVTAWVLRLSKRVAAGCYHTGSRDYLRIWLRTGMLAYGGRWLSGSLYWRWWLRLAGMRLGRNCEISTILDVLPEQVSIGAETFLADGIYLGGPRLRAGTATVASTSLANDSFLGNHAVVLAGTELPPDILIGVATVADAGVMRAGTSWFGHPPMQLPQREIVDLDRTLTHEPTLWLYVHRLGWETLRFALPAVTILVAMLWLDAATTFGGWWLPALTIAAGAVLAALVLVAKWALLGRVRPGTHGLWSAWCCRWDFLYMAWGMLAHGVLSPLGGTLLLPWYLRAMGMRIGKRVVLAGSFAQVVDPDMLNVAAGATIDPMFQAHTFEDRVLKIGPLHIGENATVGRATVLFYGTRVEPRCTVAPHSVVMKNETLSAGRTYSGVPTRGVAAGAGPMQSS